MKIDGNTFIISGGASGLGRATVEDIYQHGGFVAILDLKEDLANEVIQSLGSDRLKFFSTDVTNSDSIKASVDKVATWSEDTKAPVRGIVCCAGISIPSLIVNRHGEPLAMDSFKLMMDVNVYGTVELIRLSLPHILQTEPSGDNQERGIIVMVASSAATEGQMGQVGYAASKGAVVSMTLPMARDLSKHHIRVMTLAPAMFESPMTQNMSDKVKESLSKAMEFPKRAGKPCEFAEVVRACIESSMLNGETIRIDGATRMPARL